MSMLQLLVMCSYGRDKMNLEIQKDKIRLHKVTHAVRAQQAVLQYGVGAMIDFPDQTLMTAAPEYWQERVEQIHDERLEKVLHVDYFGMPGNKDEAKYSEGISYTRFPEWYFCPKCRKFQPIMAWIDDYKKKGHQKEVEIDPFMVKHMRCPVCRQDLVVARIVTVCEHGHIDDFPWVKWVHCQNIMGGPKRICKHPALTFKTGASSTEGLEGLEIHCETCGAKATLRGAFEQGKFEKLDKLHHGEYDFSCAGRHPWKHTHEACGKYPRVLQRGSSSVYFPVIASSLVIPPYSNMLTTRIESSSAFYECKTTITNMVKIMQGITQDDKDAMISNAITQFSGQIALEIGTSIEQVANVLQRKWQMPSSVEQSTISVKYRSEEYEALSGEISLGSEDYGDFIRESTNIDDYNIPFVKKISLIHKIREVQALIGFTRIKPAERSEFTSEQPNVISVKEEGTNWYPAYQVRGEGIFIEFDQNAINLWRTNNPDIQHRIDTLNENYRKSFIGSNNPRTISAKFLLLHTISHLLIKQLSFECGYSIASLKERIYCSEAVEGKEMAGLLVYTASGDSEGTMGGLVRQGRADAFPRMFKKAIEASMTCSNDPVCSLSLGQGRDSLNLAACYSCTLIPETSCEEFNIFLDRGVVVGTFNKKDMGLFSNVLYGENGWASIEKIAEHEEPQTTKEPQMRKFVVGTGTDMQDVAYSDIWENLLQWSKNNTERMLLKALIDCSHMFLNKEKPLYDCEFMFAGSSDKHKCDLAWRESKVAFFSEENEEDYLIAVDSDWTCFCGTDTGLSVDKLLATIKEK